MDTLLLILKYLAQGSIILGGVLWIYWFQFTEEANKLWRTKLKNLNMQELDEKEREVDSKNLSDVIQVIKNGSALLKIAFILTNVFFASMAVMIIIVIVT